MTFQTTREMDAWISATKIDGPCCVVDSWAYGRVLVLPTTRSFETLRNGVWTRHSFVAKDWTTRIDDQFVAGLQTA